MQEYNYTLARCRVTFELQGLSPSHKPVTWFVIAHILINKILQIVCYCVVSNVDGVKLLHISQNLHFV